MGNDRLRHVPARRRRQVIEAARHPERGYITCTGCDAPVEDYQMRTLQHRVQVSRLDGLHQDRDYRNLYEALKLPFAQRHALDSMVEEERCYAMRQAVNASSNLEIMHNSCHQAHDNNMHFSPLRAAWLDLLPAHQHRYREKAHDLVESMTRTQDLSSIHLRLLACEPLLLHATMEAAWHKLERWQDEYAARDNSLVAQLSAIHPETAENLHALKQQGEHIAQIVKHVRLALDRYDGSDQRPGR